MIEIFTSGFFVGRPHEVGGGGAIVMSEREELGRVKRAFQAGEVARSIAVELAVLAEALELAKEKGGAGEEVVLRTGFASLVDLCRGRGPRATPDLEEWIARVSEAAREFSEIRAVVSPGWVTARPHDLAVRAVLDRFREARTGTEVGQKEPARTSPPAGAP
jgi:ribonuclease HI